MSEESKNLLWHRIKLIAFIGVFLAPFIGGWMAFYVLKIRPDSINYGTLVQPVKKLNWPVLESIKGDRYENGFGRKWSFVMFNNGVCNELCRSNLYSMRQIRTLLGRDSQRLVNIFISATPLAPELTEFFGEYPDFIVIEAVNEQALFDQFQIKTNEAVGATPQLYLVDPDQNYMMYYQPENDRHRVLEDIRKLIKLSRIG